jgi:hypothetical protein
VRREQGPVLLLYKHKTRDYRNFDYCVCPPASGAGGLAESAHELPAARKIEPKGEKKNDSDSFHSQMENGVLNPLGNENVKRKTSNPKHAIKHKTAGGVYN